MNEPVTEIRPHDHALVIAIRKRSLDETSARMFADDVLTAAAGRVGVPIVLDMSQVRFVPSIALGSLIQLSKGFKLDRRRLVLVGVGQHVMSTIRVTNLHTVLEVCDTLEQAVGAK